ncbi:Glucose/arabinose dehydrogenase, beta-propeller fold [Draconibacterium orientale]|uniref:Glucose sorbosone dehydrogenase n=1 Tax=Draconibacterium orientale TaxID=1168034 RepID=X5DG79_9BACT|nr:PQQ-dependent sugar dehydrogenase [Draconibacterium orientale]AHW59427.1 glucose sorbosone dehydrogenase [Draconibacterium orientale]SET27073.1 Glucose/arabinose dehydrogenase, beta-propeller fold [Draconibacterium orientale]
MNRIILTFTCLFLFHTFSANAQDGALLYGQNCASCHGANLGGGNAASLVDGIWQFGAEDGYVFRNIKFGIAHLGMPSYEATLSDGEINAIISYIRESENKVGAKKPPIAKEIETLDYKIDVEIFAEGLEVPWAIDFIDENTALITERPGRLRVVQNGKLLDEPVKNTPKVLNEGQGGLLDVAIDPDYDKNGWVYLAYSHVLASEYDGNRPPAMTRIVRGKIENNSWTSEEVLFEASHDSYRTTRHHYGCRIVFDPWGHLFFAIGDRGAGYQAQDFTLPNGKVHRIYKDGSIPADNPFVHEEGAVKSLFSLGNRNIQGMAVHPQTGELWVTEHGPMGGDELNRIEWGKNYGWETITYGKNYNGTVITEETHKPGMEQPNLYWRPSIAVCGLDFYRGDLFSKWKNKLLVGALKYEEVRLLQIEGDKVVHQEVIVKNQGRVRDVSTGPEGAIYVVLNNPGTVIKLTPQ